MPTSASIKVLLLVYATWILYLGILFLIVFITPLVKGLFGADWGQEAILIIAGVLMLAPIILVWDFFVLKRYYPSQLRRLKPEASQPQPQSE